jgi:hypothetical protein
MRRFSYSSRDRQDLHSQGLSDLYFRGISVALELRVQHEFDGIRIDLSVSGLQYLIVGLEDGV